MVPNEQGTDGRWRTKTTSTLDVSRHHRLLVSVDARHYG